MRAEKDQEIGDPDDRQPEIGIPLRLGVFLRLRDAEQIAGAGDHDEEIVAEHDEPRRDVADEARATGALHHVERRRDQHVAAEREDHRGGVQRPDAAERHPGQIEVERRKGELERRPEPDREAGDAPEHRRDGRELDRAHVVVRLAVDRERRQVRPAGRSSGRRSRRRRRRWPQRTDRRGRRIRACRLCRDDDREQRQRRKRQRRTSFSKRHVLLGGR